MPTITTDYDTCQSCGRDLATAQMLGTTRSDGKRVYTCTYCRNKQIEMALPVDVPFASGMDYRYGLTDALTSEWETSDGEGRVWFVVIPLLFAFLALAIWFGVVQGGFFDGLRWFPKRGA